MTASTPRWTRSFPDGAYVIVEPGLALAVPGRPAPQHPGAPAVQVTSLGATAVVQAGWVVLGGATLWYRHQRFVVTR